jgi:hypothetical protein
MVGKGLSTAVEKAQQILQVVEGLQRGDRVIVLWHDACRVTNDPDVRAEYYSTPKETQGTIYDCVPDPEYPSVYYLIVCGETTGGRPDYYDAIPIAWIARIEKLEITSAKRPKKERKLVTDLYTVKRVIVYKSDRLARDSGGITKLPLKWMQSDGMASRKFVEEITKVAG